MTKKRKKKIGKHLLEAESRERARKSRHRSSFVPPEAAAHGFHFHDRGGATPSARFPPASRAPSPWAAPQGQNRQRPADPKRGGGASIVVGCVGVGATR